jgi:hypothetical protein
MNTLIGGGKKPGEHDRSSPNTPRPTVSEYPGARVASPRAALPATPVLVPHITKSQSEPSVSSSGQVLDPSTLTLIALSDAPSALGIFGNCGTSASRTSDVDSPSTVVSRGEREGTVARLPMLVDDGATRSRYGDVPRCAVGRWMITADGVRLLSPKHHFLKSKQE